VPAPSGGFPRTDASVTGQDATLMAAKLDAMLVTVAASTRDNLNR